MAVKTPSALKAQFAAGKYPTAADYADLIDSATAGSGSIESFTSTSNMFGSSKPVGAIEIFVNDYSSATTVTVPTSQGNTIITVSEYGATAFVKIDDTNNYWLPIGLPIQQGGQNGDLGNQ